MKHLLLINGTMGAGKTEVCKQLSRILNKNVYLDGDWCWNMNPFVVNDETKKMVMDNISHLLNNFISCSSLNNLIFCWVMHEQWIIDDLLSRLDLSNTLVHVFTLMPDKEVLTKRLKKDIDNGLRKEEAISKSLEYLDKYFLIRSIKIDVSSINPRQAAKIIASHIK
ncbi:MAG: AAA family ATPase [Clostridia bacterium]|nr:AAA family ATPase [Clostridia bacterium]